MSHPMTVPPADNYRDTELGPLPEEWRVASFDEAIVRLERVPKVKRSEYQPFGSIPVVDQSQAFIAGFIDGIEPYSSGLPVIVFGDHTRVFKYVDFPFIAGADGTQVLLPNKQYFYPMFLYYSLLNVEIPSRGYNRHLSILREKKIPLPPLAEQRAIAHVLRTVQEAREATERVVVALRELKKSLMRHLFTYGPVALDQAEQVSVKDTGAGPAPEHWSLVTISDTCQVRGSSMLLSELQSLDTGDETDALVHGIKVADMNMPGNESWILRANLEVRLPKVIAQKKAIPPNSVVFPKRGAAIATNKKRMTSTWTVLDPNLIAVIPGPRINPIFLFYWFQRFDLTELQEPGPTPQLNKKDIDPILFPLPPMNEQQEITSILQAVDRRIAAEEAYGRALGDLFKTLLHELMTARRRVPPAVVDALAVATP